MDDEEAILKTLRLIFSAFGYEAAFANEGAKAVELYKQAMQNKVPFDIVVLDLSVPVPGVGGKETLRQLKILDPGVKAIASSGYSDEGTNQLCRQDGFAAVINKPYDIDDLKKVFEQFK